jgi:endonuclease III related protein
MQNGREAGDMARYRARMARRSKPTLPDVYERLRGRFGHAGWWPAETPFEVALGAILVQNTSWTNVERVLAGLRGRGLLSHRALFPLAVPELAELFRASGTFNVKARRVRAFLEFLEGAYGGQTERMASAEPSALRAALLAVPGIGPETADCIVLYAAGHASFVVDAYTRRVFGRIGLLRGGESYEGVQGFFHGRLPADPLLFNDYHAQIVRLAKDFCRPRPLCTSCPLDEACARVGVARSRPGRR